MSNLTEYAKSELLLLNGGKGPDNEYDQMMHDAILEMVETFAKQGHSGFSASWTIACLKKLLAFEPLTPLTGEDSEWNDIGGGWQNRRCSHVFKGVNGRAYDIQGRVFREPSGTSFTSFESRTLISFPYTPTVEFIDVGEDGEPLSGPSRAQLVADLDRDGVGRPRLHQ